MGFSQILSRKMLVIVEIFDTVSFMDSGYTEAGSSLHKIFQVADVYYPVDHSIYGCMPQILCLIHFTSSIACSVRMPDLNLLEVSNELEQKICKMLGMLPSAR